MCGVIAKHSSIALESLGCNITPTNGNGDNKLHVEHCIESPKSTLIYSFINSMIQAL